MVAPAGGRCCLLHARAGLFRPGATRQAPEAARYPPVQGHGPGDGGAPRGLRRRGAAVDGQHVQRDAGLPDRRAMAGPGPELGGCRAARLPATAGLFPLPLSGGHVRAAALPAGEPLAGAGGGGGLRLLLLLPHHHRGRAQQQGHRRGLHAHGARRAVHAAAWPEIPGRRALCLLPGPAGACQPPADHLLPRHAPRPVRPGRAVACRAR